MNNIIYHKNDSVNREVLKIAFLGTSQFALPILEKLVRGGFKPAAVFCAPDKPIGRKQILTPPPAKLAAQKHDIPVFQPKTTSDLKSQILSLKLELAISAAYGLILPKEILDLPKFDCLNIHPSLLPKYRGASPIQAAILNGDAKTGVTIFKMNAGIDTGPIIAISKWPMANSKITTPELSEKLSEIGAKLLLDTLPDWLAGKITPQPQDESQASSTKQIKKGDGLIDWQKTAAQIERQVRAYNPWPGTFAKLEDENLKILEAEISEMNSSKKIGELFLDDNKELIVQAVDKGLLIKKVQPEGGKPMNAQDFLRGHKEIIGRVFEN